MSGDQPNGDAIIVLPTPSLAKAPADWFTGDAWRDGITDGAGGGCAVSDGAVSPEGTDRMALPHRRSGAPRDRRARTRRQPIAKRPGDIVFTPPGIEDWHGAAPDSFIAQLAGSESSTEAGGADVDWDDHASDDEYTTATTSGEAERSRR